MPDALGKERDINCERLLTEGQQRPEQQEPGAEESKYIEDWIARQPSDGLRQLFADGLLSYREAENLIAAEALDHLLGPAYRGHFCDVCSRERFLYDSQQGCEEWETHDLPANLSRAWNAIKAKLPEGALWSFYEVFPCVEKRIDPLHNVSKLIYIAKLIVPIGPFRFQRAILLR